MAKNKNRSPDKSDASKKSAPEQGKNPADQMESTQGGGKMERKRQTRKFGHN